MKYAAFGITLLCVAPQLCGSEASESVTDRMDRQKLILFAQRNFTTERCHETVDEVHKNGKYTEESITPICEREMKWEKCDFFSEALSLSTSHPDFNKSQFCNNMDQAHFCSSSMDNLLMSLPVSDLAYGQCTRAKPKKSDAYCKKFQRMFAYAVQSEDLDTIRACYMIQAYSNMTASQKELEEEPEPEKTEKKPVTPAPQSRIITSSGTELDPAGKGKPHGGEHRTPEGVTKFGDHGIVVQPQPLEDFGGGEGHFVSPNRSKIATPTPAPEGEKKQQASTPPPEKSGTIIVEPVAATEAGGQALVASVRAVQSISASQPHAQSAVATVPVAPASPAVEMREVVVQLPALADAAQLAAQLGGQIRVLPVAEPVHAVAAQQAFLAAKVQIGVAQPLPAQAALQTAAVPASMQSAPAKARAHADSSKPIIRQPAPLAHVAGQLKTGHTSAHALIQPPAHVAGPATRAGLAQVHRGSKEYGGFMSGFVDSS